MTVHVLNHVEQGTGLFLEQYKDKPILYAWAKVYLRQVQLLEDAIWDVILRRTLEKAVGAQLDTIGQLVDEKRRDRTDELYRVFIGAKILVNRSKGSTKDILDLLAVITATALRFKEFKPACLYVELLAIPEHDPVLIFSYLRDAKAGGVKLSFVSPTSDTLAAEPRSWDEADVEAQSLGDATAMDQTFGLLSDAVTLRDPAAEPIVAPPGPPVVLYVTPSFGPET
jgi:hypothetical protein